MYWLVLLIQSFTTSSDTNCGDRDLHLLISLTKSSIILHQLVEFQSARFSPYVSFLYLFCLIKSRIPTRRINDIDEDEDITLVNVQDGANKEMFDMDTLTGDEVFTEQEVAAKDVNLTVDEVTLAQALVALKSVKPKVKGDVIEESSVPVSAVSASTKAKVQDKGKGILVEPEKPSKKKDQLKLDEEITLKLQAEIDEEERIARAKEEKIDEANIAWDDIQVKVDADYSWLKDCKLKNKSAKRAEEKRNKPPTKTQQKKTMINYLKNVEETAEEDDDQEAVKKLMEIVLDKEEVAIDSIPLAVKSPRIVDWKIHKEGKKSYYQIVRADGKSQIYLVFSHMLKSFDREDLKDLYKLVKARYGSTRPVEDLDLILLNDLKNMFEPHVEDIVWRNQQGYKVLEWK
ncbi:hypothetical protein Tco_1206557, partial [Tanacetum coccineum]